MDTKEEIVFELWRLEERRCYFLMSSAGAGIGYALATINPEISVASKIVFLISLTLWAASFSWGLYTLHALKKVIMFSRNSVEFHQQENPSQASQAKVSEALAPEAEKHGDELLTALKWQVALLFLGAIFFSFAKFDILALICKS